MSSPTLETKFLEEQQNLLHGEDDDGEVLHRKGRRRDYNTVLWVGVVTGMVIGVVIGFMFSAGTKDACLRTVIPGSPLLEDLDISYQLVTFNGSLMKENVFRHKAGPEVDTVWESLGVNYRSVAVPLERARSAGIEPDQVKINPKYGGGYPANVEGLHQLHCLSRNLLRQALYYNFDYYHALGKGAFKNEDHILQLHVSHCLDILRQQLMCTVDIGVLGQVWYNITTPTAFVDFNTRHKCRNFDAVRQWAEVRQLPEQVPNDFLQPPEPGDKIYPDIP